MRVNSEQGKTESVTGDEHHTERGRSAAVRTRSDAARHAETIRIPHGGR